ncbi:UNKNOWN [Stylonychia lemnae]|uniref:Uncharacterized protein n=1 Tax=Stylonychia lemnae TaxID=5949 RepID=A0A078AYP7_STYLE|nr:UNKNOWN [Stylonychia lemnae]|eukprot:CDW87560.1 UNKNOWN [Stylonychia lemnae]
MMILFQWTRKKYGLYKYYIAHPESINLLNHMKQPSSFLKKAGKTPTSELVQTQIKLEFVNYPLQLKQKRFIFSKIKYLYENDHLIFNDSQSIRPDFNPKLEIVLNDFQEQNLLQDAPQCDDKGVYKLSLKGLLDIDELKILINHKKILLLQHSYHILEDLCRQRSDVKIYGTYLKNLQRPEKNPQLKFYETSKTDKITGQKEYKIVSTFDQISKEDKFKLKSAIDAYYDSYHSDQPWVNLEKQLYQNRVQIDEIDALIQNLQNDEDTKLRMIANQGKTTNYLYQLVYKYNVICP